VLAPFAGAIYIILRIFGSDVPDFFGYGVGPVETFLVLGFILLLFKTAVVVTDFNMRLYDRIFEFVFKKRHNDKATDK
jgi:hypothetical protein